jgi:uncharacterized repeat protein (TIGR02543 family)
VKIIEENFVVWMKEKRRSRVMTKKERIRLLIGVAFMAVIFFAVASIGWTKAEFIVVYNYGFDGKVETNIVKKGYVKEPPSTGRYGYTFDGWYYLDKQGNEILFDFETEPVTRDLDLTAHWKPFETEMLFVLPMGYGECEVESMTVPYGSEFTLPKAERKGYYFVGWEIFDGFFLTDGVWTYPDDEFKLYARWSKFRPGQTYFLGEYEQNLPIYENGKLIGWEKEPIEWIPIDQKDGKYLMVTKYVIDAKALDSERKYKSWADCDLREWLNGEFIDKVFSEEEKAMLCGYYDEKLGTTDKVFLLSRKETQLLYGTDIFGFGTKYAKLMGCENPNAVSETGWGGVTYTGYGWTLRSFEHNMNYHSFGGAQGSMKAHQIYGLRPAIWVDAEKLNGR